MKTLNNGSNEKRNILKRAGNFHECFEEFLHLASSPFLYWDDLIIAYCTYAVKCFDNFVHTFFHPHSEYVGSHKAPALPRRSRLSAFG